MIYDRNYLIALQGRKRGFTAAAAREWIIQNDSGPLYIPLVVAMEFRAGFKTDDLVAPFLRKFIILPINDTVLDETARIMQETTQKGEGIGMADSIIAATARVYRLTLVTDNVRHFKRVAGIEVKNYL